MKRVLITGANRGLGLALATECAKRGYIVFATCRDPEKATRLITLEAKHKNQVALIRLDVTDEAGIAAAANLASECVPSLDLLINNAAVHFRDVSISEVEPQTLLETLYVNAVGPVLVAKYFRPMLARGDNPKLINISSEAGSITKMTRFRGYAYYGSKAAENLFSRALAFDPEMEGILVVAMHPGWVRTDMGGPNAHITAKKSAAGILRVIDHITQEDNGNFYTWEGNTHPW